ncbi:type II toxin-antitoxin system VapC family toxin [Pseudonocardia sp. GCM10023141]|uniref:type II toxin-antitoxin system VapC family toxin n=1 Tax=Pseudonocardia sp. GCM10023141 TaxID=3252653 RepID=UPI00361DE2F5
MELVLDASAAVSALTGVSDPERALRARLVGEICFAPHLIDAEVGSVLRRRVSGAALEATTAEAALLALNVLVNERYPHGPLAFAAWALRHTITYYDALYVALAARLGIPLLTADARLAKAPGLTCEVELIS